MKLRNITKQLGSSLEARMLVKHITNLSDADLIGMEDIPLTADQSDTLDSFIVERLNGRPISKIIGYKEFYGREFYVTEDVLDPRPETELIIDTIIRHCERSEAIHTISPMNGLPRSHTLPRNDGVKILDLGTGSGCIILTLLAELPNATGIGADISNKALDVAKRNAELLNISDRITFIESNWLESIEGPFDVIVTNPPYIETRTLDDLDKDVRDYDPIMALDGGHDGLNPYKAILPQIRTYLNDGGFFMCEHGTGQSDDIVRLMENADFEMIRVHHDLAGHDRCVSGLIPQT